MRVLVTGASGTLGAALLPRLAARRDAVVAIDRKQGSAPADWVIGDIRDPAVLMEAAEGVDLIVHAAAFHGIHLSSRSRREFYELNVLGTFNVWEAAIERRIRGIVFSSTMGVYGESRRPPGDHDVVFVDERMPLLPADIYGWTKVAGEELCRYHARASGIPSMALRYGMFVPEPFFRYGIRLLYGGVDEADVADTVIAALDASPLASRASRLSTSIRHSHLPTPTLPTFDRIRSSCWTVTGPARRACCTHVASRR